MKDGTPPRSPGEQRQDKLAAALRANLRRRKGAPRPQEARPEPSQPERPEDG